jgi:hypothetical protein
MPTIVCNVAALAVASIFYTWRAYRLAQLHRHRTLRERVAFMLWVMANNAADVSPDTESDSTPEMGLTALQT